MMVRHSDLAKFALIDEHERNLGQLVRLHFDARTWNIRYLEASQHPLDFKNAMLLPRTFVSSVSAADSVIRFDLSNHTKRYVFTDVSPLARPSTIQTDYHFFKRGGPSEPDVHETNQLLGFNLHLLDSFAGVVSDVLFDDQFEQIVVLAIDSDSMWLAKELFVDVEWVDRIDFHAREVVATIHADELAGRSIGLRGRKPYAPCGLMPAEFYPAYFSFEYFNNGV